MLLLVAFLEVAINRVAVPMLRPDKGVPPEWHTWLDNVGLFLFYFTGALAVLVIATRVVAALRERRGPRDIVAQLALGAAALVAAVPLGVPAPAEVSFVLELAFAASVLALVAAGFARDRDLGVQLGMIVIAVPLLVHTVNVVGAKFLWPEAAFDTPGVMVARAGVMALCVAALLSPYAFAPRP